MQLKSYQAKSMREVMRLVRDELGDEAVIISTVEDGGLVRATAALERPDPDPGTDPYPDPRPATAADTSANANAGNSVIPSATAGRMDRRTDAVTRLAPSVWFSYVPSGPGLLILWVAAILQIAGSSDL